MAYQSISSSSYGAVTTSATVTAPAGALDSGYVYFMLFQLRTPAGSNPGAPTATSGAVQIGTDDTGTHAGDGANYRVSYWRKAVSGSEPGSYTFTFTNTGFAQLVAAWYTGHGSVNVFSQANASPANTTRTLTGVTTTVNNCEIIGLCWDWADNTNNETVPTGSTPTFTERLDNILTLWFDGTLATAGATGNKTNTCNSGSGKPRGGMLVAVEPAASNKTLDANSASFSISGTAATLRRGLKVAANGATYSISATATTLKRTLKVAANSASYSISGSAITFARARELIAASASYSISGTATNTEVHRKVAANSASYSISGSAVTLRTGKALSAQPASYSISGATAALLLKRKMVVAESTYSISALNATLAKSSDKVLILEPPTYSINASDVRLAYSHRIIVAQGTTYQIGGQAVSLFKGLPIPRNSLNAKVRNGGAGSMGDLARMGSDIEMNFGSNKKIKEYGAHFWGDYVKQGGDVME